MASSIVEAFSLSHAQILDGNTAFLAAALAGTTPEALDVYGVNDGKLSPKIDEWENEGDDQVLSIWSWLKNADVEVQAGYLSFPLLSSLTGQAVVQAGAQAATNEVQGVAITASAGTYTLTVAGQTTAPLAYSATTAAVQTALLLLNTVDDTDIVVTGTPAALILTFGGKYAGQNVAPVAVGTGSLTGTAVVTQTTVGSPAYGDSYSIDLWHEDSMNSAPKPMILKMPSKDRDGLIRTLTIGLYKVQFKPVTFDGPKYKDGLKVNYGGSALAASKDEMGVVFPDGKRRFGKLISHG